MKKLAIILIMLPLAAYANLIDVTPGGFNVENIRDWPQPYRDLINLLNSNQLVNIPNSYVNVTGYGTPNGSVSWDLTGSQFSSLQWVLVTGFTQANQEFANLYQVTTDQWIRGEGLITVDGVFPIIFVEGFGHGVSDKGAAGLMFMLALMALCFFGHRCRLVPE